MQVKKDKIFWRDFRVALQEAVDFTVLEDDLAMQESVGVVGVEIDDRPAELDLDRVLKATGISVAEFVRFRDLGKGNEVSVRANTQTNSTVNRISKYQI